MWRHPRGPFRSTNCPPRPVSALRCGIGRDFFFQVGVQFQETDAAVEVAVGKSAEAVEQVVRKTAAAIAPLQAFERELIGLAGHEFDFIGKLAYEVLVG